MNADMTKEMIDDAMELSLAAFEKYTVEKEIATAIKRDMAKKHPGTWQCVVGRNFGTFVTHETKVWRSVISLLPRPLSSMTQQAYINFHHGPVSILLYRTCS